MVFAIDPKKVVIELHHLFLKTKRTQLSAERFLSLTRDLSLRSSFQLISWRRALMWRHRSRGEHVGLIDSQPAIALKAQARGPSSFGVKGSAFYNGPVLVIRQSSCSSLQHLGQTRHDAIRHFDWARVDFFYRRLRKRDTMSRSRHRVQRQRGRSADEREALQTDTARAARSVRATLNFALRVHRIFSVRQIVPVDSPLLSTSRREIDVFQPLAKAWTKTNPAGWTAGV